MVLVFWNDHLEHRLPVDFPFLGGVFHLGLAIHLRSGLYHVDLLVGAYAGNGAVVFDTHQEPPSVGVGESGKGTGNATTVRNLELEIKHLMLAFEDEVLNMVVLLSHSGQR